MGGKLGKVATPKTVGKKLEKHRVATIEAFIEACAQSQAAQRMMAERVLTADELARMHVRVAQIMAGA